MNVGIYATVEQVKEYLLGQEDLPELVKDDQRIAKICYRVSRSLEKACKRRRFYPIRETRYFDHPPESDQLWLDDDLLEVIALATNNGGTTITSENFYGRQGQSYQAPYSRICLREGGTPGNFTYSGSPQRANSIDGLWGYHDDWAGAWQQVDAVQDDPLAINATVVNVGDVDGLDEMGFEPRFLVQQLIRFGAGATAEMAYITAKDVDNNRLTISRGVNGSAAAQQANNTAIYVYRPMEDAVKAAVEWASYEYRRKDSVGTEGDRPFASATGVMVLPSALPSGVRDFIKEMKRKV